MKVKNQRKSRIPEMLSDHNINLFAYLSFGFLLHKRTFATVMMASLTLLQEAYHIDKRLLFFSQFNFYLCEGPLCMIKIFRGGGGWGGGSSERCLKWGVGGH